MNRPGLISIGTNSTRALVVQFEGVEPQILLHRSTGTRIGEGLKERGRLGDAAMERTLGAIREHARAVRELTNDLCVIATSALRRAENGGDFALRVLEIAGAGLEIISGEEEAQYSFAGAVSGLIAEGPAVRFGVVDVGGGSAEYAAGTCSEADSLISCEIGAVRLTEAVPSLAGAGALPSQTDVEKARALARYALAPIATFPPVDRLVFVGGSATKTVSLVRGTGDYFDYADLERAQLRATIERLRSCDLESRKVLPGMDAQRADILLAGTVILDEIFEAARRDSAAVSSNDVLLGFLLRRRIAPNG